MELSLKRKLAIGATGLVVLGGGGAAYAVTNSKDNGREAFLGDVAKRLNVTPQQLNNAIKGAFEDRLQAAVKAGKLTQAQADQIKKKVEAAGGVPFVGPGPGFGRGHFFLGRGPGGPLHDAIGAASKYLGLTDKQLFDRLSSGKSLADVAGAQNKSVDGLKGAIKDAVKADLDSAVKAGKINQTQENNILSRLDNRLDKIVNRKGLAPPPLLGKRKAFGAKHGFHFGAAPAGGPPPGLPIF